MYLLEGVLAANLALMAPHENKWADPLAQTSSAFARSIPAVVAAAFIVATLDAELTRPAIEVTQAGDR